jgi:NNP family nitrate/nitrite transporter-like MFS transporter
MSLVDETKTTLPTSAPTAPPPTLAPPARRPGRSHWISDWDPENERYWAEGGSKVARRNLVFSIFSEHVGFSVWTMWSTLVLFLGPKYGFTPAQKFTLTSVPIAFGAVLRLPYTFAVATFGGRNWTIISAVTLLVPTTLTAVLLEPGVGYSTLLILGALAGVGGGNFASSMTNINAFYPNRHKGWALGLNAAGGNLGVATIQLVGLLILATAGAAHPRLVVALYIPLIVVSALGATFFMDNLTCVSNDKRAIREVCREPHTWAISFLYIGTFGSFIGFGFAFGQVLQVQFHDQFDTPLKAAQLTFLGPLIGSLSRPVGGFLADRFGGALVTFVNFVAMTVSAITVLMASRQHSLGMFLIGFICLFVFSGAGNGSTYKMIPAIFKAKADLAVRGGADRTGAAARARRRAGALLGLAGAIGASGGVLVNIAFRQSFLHTQNGNAAYLSFVIFYGACVTLTWVLYLRPSRTRLAGV